MNSILTGIKESIDLGNYSDFTEDISFIRDYMWKRKYALMGKYNYINDESDFLQECLPVIERLLKLSVNYDEDYQKLEEENDRLKQIEDEYEEKEDYKKLFLKCEKEIEKLQKDLDNERKDNVELYDKVLDYGELLQEKKFEFVEHINQMNEKRILELIFENNELKEKLESKISRAKRKKSS